ncbi:MAG TPA: site-2 protease family protein, partial [Bryobacteraceae bacterium]|nr:site-2 protease family protein [Bryobacteraceae bacterium]
DAETLALGFLWYVIYLLSTTCHEAAHALAAKMGGDLTAFHGGQVSLDPLPHIRREPLGMVLFPILTYLGNGWMMGWASAPYDPYWSQRHPHRAGWMSLAGPAANTVLAILAALLIHAGLATGVFRAPESVSFAQMVAASAPGWAEGAAKALSILFSLNILLATFNLLPVPPLDGFAAVGLLMREERARRFEAMKGSLGMLGLLGLFLGWQLYSALYDPIFGASLKILYPGLTYSQH